METEKEKKKPAMETTKREEEEGGRLGWPFCFFLSFSPFPLLPLLHSCYLEICLCLAKQIADTASSKLWIGRSGQVGLLTSEGSESRGGEERQDRGKDNINPLHNSPNCNPLGLMVYVCVGIIHLSMMLVPALILLCVSERRKASLRRRPNNASRGI